MQPVLSIVAPMPGLISLNGRPVGETGPEAPLTLPVRPGGAQYLGFTPLTAAVQPLTRRLVLSGGRLQAGSLGPELSALAWPGGVIELRVDPPRSTAPIRRQRAVVEGVRYALAEGAETYLEVGSTRLRLPDGADLPRLMRREGLLLFTGRVGHRQRYLAAVPEDGAGAPTLLCGAAIETSGPLVHVVAPRTDTVGHALLETWRIEDGTLALARVEPAWAHGAPAWPRTPGDTVRALFEAHFLGLRAEAEVWLTPRLAADGALARAAGNACACVPLRSARGDAPQAVGLVKWETPNCGEVVPVHYRAVPGATAQGKWRIAELRSGG